MTQAEIKVFYNKTTQASAAVQKDAALAASCVLGLMVTFEVRFRMRLPLDLGEVSIHVFLCFPHVALPLNQSFRSS